MSSTTTTTSTESDKVLVSKARDIKTNGVDSVAVNAIVSDISKKSEDEQWENLLGTAPKTLCCIAQCFIVALEGNAGTITQERDKSLPRDLRTNLVNCTDLGLEAFKKAESKMYSVSKTIGTITEPYGVMDGILDTIDDELHGAVQDAADTSDDLVEQLEKLRVLAATCSTDSGSVVETISEWQGLAKRINSAFTETLAIETERSEEIDGNIARAETSKSQGIIKRTIRRVVGGQSPEQVRSDLQKLSSKKTEKKDVIEILNRCLNNLTDIKAHLEDLNVFFDRLHQSISDLSQKRVSSFEADARKITPNVATRKIAGIHREALRIRLMYMHAHAKSSIYAKASRAHIAPGVKLIAGLNKEGPDAMSVSDKVDKVTKYFNDAEKGIKVFAKQVPSQQQLTKQINDSKDPPLKVMVFQLDLNATEQ